MKNFIELNRWAEISAGGGAPQDPNAFSKNNEGHPFIRAGSLPKLLGGDSEASLEHLTEEVAKSYRLRLYPKDTIVFAKSGMSATKGHIYQLKQPSYVVNHLATIVPSEELFPSYLKYWFQQNPPSRLIKDDAYPSIRLSEISEIKIPETSIKEQQRIAQVLDKADALREKRRAAITKLDELLQSVFLDMFGDPVSNPKGWDKVEFDRVCQTKLGKMLDKKKQKQTNQSPYLRNANVQWNYVDTTSLYEMYFDEKEKKLFQLQYGDLLICEGGEVGRTAIWRDEISECYYQKAIHRGRPKKEKATSEYLLFLMLYLSKFGGFKSLTTVATIAHLTSEKLKSLEITVPPIDLQKQFTKKFKEIEKIKSEVLNASEKTENLFQSLQQRAFSGKLFGANDLVKEANSKNSI